MKNLKDIINEDFKLKKKASINNDNHWGEYVVFFPWAFDFTSITSNKIFRDTSKKYTQHALGEDFSIFIITYDDLKESLIDAKLNFSVEETRVYLIPDNYDIEELIKGWQSKKLTLDDIGDKFKNITEEFKHWRDLK